MKKIIRIFSKIMLLPLLGIFSFSGLDLSQDNRLLFSLTSKDNGFRQGYQTLVMNRLDQGSQQILSFFPEKIHYLQGQSFFYIQNRLGLFLGDLEGRSMTTMDFYPSFSTSQSPNLGRLDPLVISPDGNYIIYFNRTGIISGDLVLRDLERQRDRVITQDFEPDLNQPLVKWSPDSRLFCYSKDNQIYYYSLSQYLEGRDGIDLARVIGRGGINSFNWTRDNSLVYIEGKNIYKVHATEIFALSFYDTPLQIGTVAGRLFVDYNNFQDEFWLSPDGRDLLIKKGEGNIFLYDMEFRDYNLNSQIRTLPFMKLPVGSTVEEVIWSSQGKITILTRNRLNQGGGNLIFIYDPAVDSNSIVPLNQQGILDIELSPDENLISLITPLGIQIRGYEHWELIQEITMDGVLNHSWIDNGNILFFSEQYSGRWNYVTDQSELLYMSQVSTYGFNTQGEIQTQVGEEYYIWDEDTRRWESSLENYLRDARLNSAEYRVFMEPHGGVYYDEMVMLRKIDGYGTHALLEDVGEEPEAYPLEESNPIVTDDYFIHGSRIRRRELSLVFNITSEDDGLLEVLNTLSEYGIRATFFVNGDFIRKYPGALRILVDEGHEIGSLFYTNIDFSNRQYTIDEDFIIRGIARNEDEFFKATGHEVSTLWHAPWYYVDQIIIDASREINYTYVSRDIDSLDWVGLNDDVLYAPSSELIDRIMEMKKPGSIISLSIGVEENRNDYLYQKLDLIINELLRQGYDIVDVSTLIENAR